MPDESNNNILNLTGYGTNFGAKEARLALAIAAAGVGGSGGSSATDVQNGIDASTDIDSIITLLTTLSDLLSEPSGAYVEKNGTIGTSAVELEPAAATREAFKLQNKSNNIIYIRFGNTADTTNSHKLNPDSTYFSTIKPEIQQSISIIADTANSQYSGYVIQ